MICIYFRNAAPLCPLVEVTNTVTEFNPRIGHVKNSLLTLPPTLTLTLTLTLHRDNHDVNSGVRARNLSNGCSQLAMHRKIHSPIHSSRVVTPLRMSTDPRNWPCEHVSLF